MLFNSYTFWVFFGVVLFLYRVLPHRGQNWMLLVASYVFYGAWDWRFLSLILFSTSVDYLVAIALETPKYRDLRKVVLGISCSVNLGLLGFFKYFNFFAQELTDLLAAMGLEFMKPSINIVLPVGISFYTFQAMSYTIDVYRGRVRAVTDLVDFALYVAFFPQLVAGPIERSTHLLPQVMHPREKVRASDFSEGLWLILWGLFKKVVIADNMVMIVNGLFAEDPRVLTGPECWVAVYAFALQIYCDFSGYTAIARGVARWMGFHLSQNFLFPYFSVTPSEFWSRWHISLSSWLRDYLYIPLGGNRAGVWKTCRNLMLTMLLGGLWHGAAWTFVVWGFLHGILLIGYRFGEKFWSRLGPRSGSQGLWRFPLALLFFHLVCVGWLFFRAENFDQAWTMLAQMFTSFQGSPVALYGLSSLIFFGLPILLLELWLFLRDDDLLPAKKHWSLRGLVYSYLAFMLMTFAPLQHHEFIYFQF